MTLLPSSGGPSQCEGQHKHGHMEEGSHGLVMSSQQRRPKGQKVPAELLYESQDLQHVLEEWLATRIHHGQD